VMSLASPVVVLSLYALGLHPVVFIARSGECRELPRNILAAKDLRPSITRLISQSRILRAQCLRIAASPETRVTVTLSLSPMDAEARARSVARRYQTGLLIVDIQLPPASRDFAELLAHEFEHVLELIDGVDFKALARAGGGQVSEKRSDGSFESERARRAGILAAAEVSAGTSAGAAAVARGLSGAWRSVRRFARLQFRR
jgi:hypothetical protein